MKTSHQYPEHVVRRALTEQRYPSDNGWFQRHRQAAKGQFMPVATDAPEGDEHGAQFELALLDILSGLTEYAGAHVRQYDSPIADDGVIGEAWLDALRGLRALLNGELGRLDGGTLDHAILELYKAAGFEGEL